MDIVIKTVKDVANFDKLSWVAIILSVFIPVLSERITRNEIDLFSIIYWFLGIIALLVISFWILFTKNYFAKNWLLKNIEIEPVSPDKSYDGKVLLEIKNNNYGDKFTEVKVELLKFIGCDEKGEYLKGGNGDFAYLDIKQPDMTFKKGLLANNFTIDSDGGKVQVEIAEDLDGVLKLLFDRAWEWDVLLRNETDMVVYQYYGTDLRVSGKIMGFHFSKDFLYKIVHGIDHRTVIISGKDGSEKTPSKVMWVVQPENG